MSRRELLIVIILLALTTVLGLPILTYPMARDHGVFGTIAWGILDGHPPFTGYWDFKPPAIYYLFAAAIALFGQTALALRLIDILFFPLMGASMYWIARRLSNRRVALLSVFGLAAFYFSESFWSLTQNDGLALLPMMLATACAFKCFTSIPQPLSPMYGERGVTLWWAFLSGVFACITLWFKYTFALFVAALVIGHIFNHYVRRAPNWRTQLLKEAIAFTLGALMIGLGGLAYMASLGVLDDMILSAQLVAPYTGMSYDNTAWYQSPVWIEGMQERINRWGILLPFVVAWLGMFVYRVRRNRAQHGAPLQNSSLPSGWLTIWLWLITMLINVLIQAKGISYQWLPILPPLLLIAADTVDRLISLITHHSSPITHHHSLSRWFNIVTILALVLMLIQNVWLPALPYITGNESQMDYYARFRGGEFLASESLEVVEYLRAHNVPNDTLYIWGFRPEIYYLAELRPATRFISQFPLVTSWYPPEWQQENVDQLWAALPPYVLVLQADNMPWVTGRTEDSNQLLQEYTELNNWLIYNYERETQIGNFFIWHKKAQPG
jgi:4-amino-4-deoxy-L-arabinose transferase-like glycosyltransferase